MKNLPAYIGITAALLMAVCDVILLGQPVSGSYYDMSSFGAVAQVSPERAAIGSAGGLFFAFFIGFGYWFVKTRFDAINPKLAALLFISLASVMFFGGAFHAGYYFVAQGNLPVADHQWYLEVLSYFGVPGFVAGTILFYILASNKAFPAWYRFCNPLIVSAVFLVIFYFLPAPIGGYLKPTFVNLGTATFFLISLFVSPSKA